MKPVLIALRTKEHSGKPEDLPPEIKIPMLYLLLNYLETIIFQKNEFLFNYLLILKPLISVSTSQWLCEEYWPNRAEKPAHRKREGQR